MGLRLAQVRVFMVDFGLRRKMSSENAAFFLILNFVGGGPVGPRVGDGSCRHFGFYLCLLPIAVFSDNHPAS